MGMSIEEMKNVDVRTVDPETLVDVTQIVIDESLPKEERVKEYLRQVKNPYCFKVIYSARLDQLSRPIRSPETLKLIS